MRILLGYLVVLAGAGLGGAVRHAVNRAGMHLDLPLPWSTVFINISGSLAMGLIAGWFTFRGAEGQTLRLFLTTGVLGGYTTFSTFSLDAALLWQRGQAWHSALYIVVSVVLSLLGVFAGLAVMRHWAG
ncbi:MAG: fluoride efflux transporter CrcB [Stellaceae bacterium]